MLSFNSMSYLSASLVLLSDLMFLKYHFKYIFFLYLKALLAFSQTQSKIQPGQYTVWCYSSLLVPPSLLHHLLTGSLTNAPTYSALRLPGAFESLVMPFSLLSIFSLLTSSFPAIQTQHITFFQQRVTRMPWDSKLCQET